MAPEYVMHGQFSVKSDVYSFGVLLLEIVSGQKNNCFRHGEHVEDLLSFVSTTMSLCSVFKNVIKTLYVQLTSKFVFSKHLHVKYPCRHGETGEAKQL